MLVNILMCILEAQDTAYKQKLSWTRAKIRRIIDKCLRKITGIENIRMKWTTYWRDIVLKHGVVIDGWPHEIVPFRNISDATGTLWKLEMLCVRWKRESTRFRELEPGELEKLEKEGRFARAPRRPRADRGTVRGRQRDPELRSKRLGEYTIKSAKYVEDAGDSDADAVMEGGSVFDWLENRRVWLSKAAYGIRRNVV
ncbi:hypothetical protein B0H21DRAFT_118400 [Amylocystis lapponica]|nr:hypothetical protein B0H21DRAFT_118400 [Amylocystis lapponica]